MAEHNITVQTADPFDFRCEDGDTLLGAALRSGLAFPYECNSGGCGSCQFELLEGEVEELWSEAPGLSEKARERGRKLACQCRPVGDVAIKAAVRSSFVRVEPAPLKQSATLVARHQLTSDMTEFTFKAERGADFWPGQFAMLALPGLSQLRAYSMSNLPNNDGLWSFIIKDVPGGKGTDILFQALNVGAEIGIDGPYGKSYLRADTERDIVCVAGGSGLSPVMSIARGVVADRSLDGKRLIIFYGGRGPSDLCVTDLVAAEPALAGRVELHTAISDLGAPGADDWQGAKGFVHDLVRDTLADTVASFDFYFCGPPPMTDALQRMLMLEYKVSGKQLFFDRFY